MTSNPTPDTETARALLWRHGVPEDVIDGALCLHGQELAAVQRREAAVWGVDTAAGKRILGAADLIDPTRAAAPAVPCVSAVGQATRDRIADVAKPFFMNFSDEEAAKVNAGELADALAAVLPPPVSRAAIRAEAFREAAVATRRGAFADTFDRMADEAQQPEVPAVDRAAVYEEIADRLFAKYGVSNRAASQIRQWAAEESNAAQLGGGLDRGTCPVCEREYKLTRVGLLPRHWGHVPDHRADDGLYCLGVGERPATGPSVAGEAQQSAVGAQASADLIEDYLRFLRGQGPEPDLSDLPSEQREAVAGQFEIVKALTDRDPELPPLDRDPVALRLGLLDAAPAAECSAQHRNFDDGRLCIRAAQHRGDHIDERGFHWSDTVAVYPVGGGTFRSGVRLSAVGARQPDTETPDLPYTYTDDDGDKFTVATTTASTLDGEAPVVTLDIDGTGGGVVYVRPERVEEVVTALRVAGHTASSAVPGRSAATDTHKETQPDPNTGPGWYEVINPRNATTNIALVHEDGTLYLPEGGALTADEFTFAAARGNAHRLVRADDQEPRP